MLKLSTVPTTSGSPDAADWLTTAALGNSINRVGNAKAMNDESTGQRSRKHNATKKAPPGAWLTAGGKLGVSTREDSDEDSETRGSGKHSTAASSKGRSAGSGAKKRDRRARPTASGVGGWLTGAATSGTLGILGDDNEDSSEDGVEEGRHKNRGRATETATVGTQWEEGAEKTGSTRSRLPPWAKPYRAPSEEATAVEDAVAADTAKEQVRGEHCSVMYMHSHILFRSHRRDIPFAGLMSKSPSVATSNEGTIVAHRSGLDSGIRGYRSGFPTCCRNLRPFRKNQRWWGRVGLATASIDRARG